LKVVLYGATGKAGSVVLKELVDRGHVVIAAARTPEKVRKVKNVTAVQDDLSDPAKTASIVKAADAVVSAYGPPPDTSQIIGVMDRLVKAIDEADAVAENVDEDRQLRLERQRAARRSSSLGIAASRFASRCNGAGKVIAIRRETRRGRPGRFCLFGPRAPRLFTCR
jgi:saccharopine dehydrogenase-like NADP-dependent oxidoreductase